MSTKMTKEQEALEYLCEQRELYGHAIGMRTAAHYVLGQAIDEFHRGDSDALATRLRDVSKQLNVDAETLFERWRNARQQRDAATELLSAALVDSSHNRSDE